MPLADREQPITKHRGIAVYYGYGFERFHQAEADLQTILDRDDDIVWFATIGLGDHLALGRALRPALEFAVGLGKHQGGHQQIPAALAAMPQFAERSSGVS
jgi:hypothetical protein